MLLLSVPVLLSACSQSIVVTADELCQSWRYQTVSKHDKLTEKTAAGIEGNNAARTAWGCHPKKDQKA
jgi:hypothetical protein